MGTVVSGFTFHAHCDHFRFILARAPSAGLGENHGFKMPEDLNFLVGCRSRP